MTDMSDDVRDAFLLERRLATLAIARNSAGPLVAPIWYRYEPGSTIDMCMSGSSAKAKRLRATGRASVSVVDEGRPYRYVTAEGPVTIEELGDRTLETIRLMASRYLGETAGARYAEQFAAPDEIIVRLTPQRWHCQILG